MSSSEFLKIGNQLCFPLYALSRQLTNMYRPLLEALDLTYPQYLVMLLLWEHRQITGKEIGRQLWLDSGTLTPVLKRLEQKGWLKRERDVQDERVLQITITDKGERLREQAEKVPLTLIQNLPLSIPESRQLVLQLQTILKRMPDNKG